MQSTNLFLASPLDQFGSDSLGDDLLDFLWCSFLDMLDILGVDNFLDTSVLAGLIPALAGLYYEDEDSADSTWEDNDLSVSNLQFSILAANILGMFPGAELNTTSACVTFFYSLTTMTTLILLGFALHNVRFMSILFPTGTPVVMTPFIILIEFVSYMARAVSLGMRLFANMFAGHSLVKILMSFAWLFLTSVIPALSLPVFALLLVIFFMEIGIAYLQAYVFGALSAMYFEDMVVLGH